MPQHADKDLKLMRMALRLARRGYGNTSPNPMVGAVLWKNGAIIGRGWHHRAGEPHAEIEALEDAQKQGRSAKGACLYVTLEPCCTHGRTPPCTGAILSAGIKKVIVAAVDPNPKHAGRGLRILQEQGIQVISGLLSEEATDLNRAFNHWIVHRTPFVTVKAAMTLDGKIATETGESKWITGEKSREYGMNLRLGSDAILVGINTILADNPSLTIRLPKQSTRSRPLRRFVLDSMAKTPLTSKVVSDEMKDCTTIVTTESAPPTRVRLLRKKVQVWSAPSAKEKVDLNWLMQRMGEEGITSLLVEGGGEVNASFLFQKIAHRVTFFYAPKVLGGSLSRKAVSGIGCASLDEALQLTDVTWKNLGDDLLLTARIAQADKPG